MRTTRWLHLTLLLAAAALPACNSGKDVNVAVPTPNMPAGSGEKPRVAFICNNPDEFWMIARRGTEKGAQEFNAEVDFQMPPRGTAEEQRQIIEDLLAKNIQGIAISPNDAANQAEFLDNEVASRVPLLTQDSDLPPGSKRLCFIGTNNYEAGRSAGKLIKEALPDGGKLMIYVGRLDAQNAVDRQQGVFDELAGQKDAKGPELGKYTHLGTMVDGGQRANCKDNVEDTLAKHPDVDGLVGLWAYNPPAILSAVKEAGKQGKIAIVAFDEDEETLGGVKEGYIHGTIVQQPYEFGYQAVRLLSALARGDKSVLPASGVLEIPHKVIKQDTVEAFHAELKQLKGQ